jgi:predicted RNase H-like HicB family nuclease
MAAFIAIVRSDGNDGYTASFPDFPGCAVAASTLDQVIAKAREALLLHIERLLEANQRIASPTAADAIERGDALLLAAVDVPDDLGIVHVDVAIPALSLARIDSFARRHGLTPGGLLVEAVARWAAQENAPRERRAAPPDGPTLFDFANPLELRVETIAAAIDPLEEPETRQAGPGAEAGAGTKDTEVASNADDITAELARLFEEGLEPQPIDAAATNARKRPGRKAE